MAARKTHQETIPPTLASEQGIRCLLRQIRRLEQHIILLPHNHSEVEGWMATTKEILNQVFGQPNGGLHIKTSDFLYARGGRQNQALPYGGYEDTQSRYVLAQEKRKTLLLAYIEQLQDLAAPGMATGPDLCMLHSEIDLVCSHLYRAGNFAEAVQEASLRVMEEVKRASGISDDGDDFVDQAYDANPQMAVLKLNRVVTSISSKQQCAADHLLKGIAGLRDSIAKDKGLFNDPVSAYEYLALASLIMRMLRTAPIEKEMLGAGGSPPMRDPKRLPAE
jgi:uncharacterized protein (TIGR02391 family)